MSGQPPQRVRRNVSPASTKQGPIKAVKTFTLKQKSPTRSLNASPTPSSHKIWSRKSPDHRASPERKSPSSPREKSKSHRQSPVPSLWRASSLDTIYLAGQWPKDPHSYSSHNLGVLTCDKFTQTPDEWESVSSLDRKKDKGHKRSASFGQGDQLKVLIKQRLQRTKEGSKEKEWSKQRQSPVQGKHSALSLTAPPTVFSQSKAIGIPTNIPKTNMSKYQRNSVEGLNTEIEKLVLNNPAAIEPEESELKVHSHPEIPDGHRAPIPDIIRIGSTRSVNTQTPSGQVDEPYTTTSSGSRADSISPAIPIIPGHMDTSRPSSRSESTDSKSSDKGEAEDSPEPSITKFVSSPKAEKCDFVREPPDGCEKVRVIEESRKPSIKESLFCPVKPNQFIFKQSQSSAFCPLIRSYCSPTQDIGLNTVPPVAPPPTPPTIEGQ
ncbi:protein FAM117B-like isoform X3 [Haliotis rubra]|uniref:protein FAM117B-like isoform X3 n=1 Tax=Haliotis rubra TaxID=36100 RepID=UPI001EE5ED1A|nr:protein FAM117B-like isoform X3 [Haliotis rubra]